MNVVWLVSLILLVGCAPDLYRIPVTLTPIVQPNASLVVVREDIEVQPSTGYTRIIKKGSVWKKVGTIPQGDVYRIHDDVFMLEGAHMHEAYAVVAKQQLVGFYLPVERAFAPLPKAVALPSSQP